MWTVSDYIYMSRAMQLAKHGLYTTHPNPRVGCVLVKNNRIIGEGWHRKTGAEHAEIHALQDAGNQARDADCYVTLEPCSHTGRTPPCTNAILEAGIKRVVMAMTDPNPVVSGNGGITQLQQHGIRTETGLLEDQAQALNIGFVYRMQKGRPYIRCKLAMSLDGRTALADGTSQWITGPEARRDVQKWRARSSAIVTGIGTVLKDDPGLDVREVDTAGRQPLRVVLDRRLRIGKDAKLFTRPGSAIVYTVSPCPEREEAYAAGGMHIVRIDGSGGRDFLEGVFRHLAREHEINEVLVECGPTLAGSLMQAGLIDELIVYMAPVLLGDEARSLLHLPGIKTMADKEQLEFTDIRMIGGDMRFILKPVKREG